LTTRDEIEERALKAEQATMWYVKIRPTYKDLASNVASIIRGVLNQKGITFHTITKRAKSIEMYREKALSGKYSDPRSQIMDMAGIRIITYLDSDARKVEEVIKSLFENKEKFSIDKTKELGTDRVGYRSIHYICSLGKDRSALIENKIYADMLFEIQIRTILQHAWAEFEHDRNYKFNFKGVLPDEIKRRLSTVAGTLELMDWTFESISKEIDQYTHDVKEKTASGDYSTAITSASLRVYLLQKFEKLYESGLKPELYNEDDTKIIAELSAVGIKTLEQLNSKIPDDFVETTIKCNLDASFLGLLRYIMIISNADDYFRKAWDESWKRVDKEAINLFLHYNITKETLKEYLKKRGTPITL
jgi:ppGpp synthetase/RelA/SpoT-type nucleotidyltranferase